MKDLLEHARLGISRFSDCHGFISGALHLSSDSTRLIQYLQWETEGNYVTCRDDPRWEEYPTTRIFLEHVEEGRATVDARTYAVVADS